MKLSPPPPHPPPHPTPMLGVPFFFFLSQVRRVRRRALVRRLARAARLGKARGCCACCASCGCCTRRAALVGSRSSSRSRTSCTLLPGTCHHASQHTNTTRRLTLSPNTPTRHDDRTRRRRAALGADRADQLHRGRDRHAALPAQRRAQLRHASAAFVSIWMIETLDNWEELMQINMFGCDVYGYDGARSRCRARRRARRAS